MCIEFIELGDDYIIARMPVEDFTRQSRGILHGGASCVLAEALGSIASNMCIDMRKQKAVAEAEARLRLRQWGAASRPQKDGRDCSGKKKPKLEGKDLPPVSGSTARCSLAPVADVTRRTASRAG